MYEAVKDHMKSDFLEAQIHEPVLLEDIDKVVFTGGTQPTPEQIEILKKYGIKWEVD